jgi:hypothetical protein
MRLSLVALVTASLLTHLSHAQVEAPDLLPGLWQYQAKTTTASGRLEAAMEQMQAQLAAMPPEQRQMVEQMMSSQGGGMNFLTNDAYTECLTQQDIQQLTLPLSEDGCSQTTEKVTASQYKLTIACPNDGMSGSGEYNIINSKNLTAKIVLQGVIEGEEETFTMTTTGKWISASCDQ